MTKGDGEEAQRASATAQPVLVDGARLAKARDDAGLTQARAAKELGLPRAQTISDWEANKYGMTLANLVALADLYHVSCDWLLARKSLPRIPGEGGIVDLRVESAINSAATLDEATSAAAKLDRLTGAGILFSYEVPPEFEVLSGPEWEKRRDALKLKLERLQQHATGKQQRGKKTRRN